MNQSDSHSEKRTVTLADFLAVIVQQWKWIVGIIAVISLIALIVSLAQTEKYRIRSIIAVGQIWEEDSYRYIEKREDLVQRITAIAYSVLRNEYRERGLPVAVKDIDFEGTRNSSFLKTEVIAPADERLIEFLETVNQSFVTDHNQLIRLEKQRLSNHINQIQNDLSDLKQERQIISQELEYLQQEKENRCFSAITLFMIQVVV